MKIEEIKKLACEISMEYFNKKVSPKMLSKPRRYEELTMARHIGIYLSAKYHPKLKYSEIAAPFTIKACSVYHAIRRINNMIDTDKRFVRLYVEKTAIAHKQHAVSLSGKKITLPIMVRDKKSGFIHQVFVLHQSENNITVNCNTWPGDHIIGQNCEFVE